MGNKRQIVERCAHVTALALCLVLIVQIGPFLWGFPSLGLASAVEAVALILIGAALLARSRR